MKLLDEKGRLFGKVNLIDIVVLFMVIFLVAAVSYKVLGPRVATAPIKKGEVTALIKCSLKNENTAMSVQKGQKLVFGTDYIEGASITDVSYTAADFITTDAQGNVHIVKHPVLKDVFITIQARTNTNAAILKVGTQELSQGKKFTVKTHTAEMDGMVEKISVLK